MVSEWRALRSGESAKERRRALAHAHEQFTQRVDAFDDPAEFAHFAADSGMRPAVIASWVRAQRNAIDPDHAIDRPVLSAEELEEVRRSHPIGAVLPVIERLLFEAAGDAGFLVAVGDAAGRLLWLDGDRDLRRDAENMGFRAGMDWSESAVGTSAPGSALALDHAIQVMGPEHYHRAVHRWSCTAAPVHDPATGAIIGVIDVTGGDGAAAPHLLPLVEATLAAVEAELTLSTLRSLIEQPRRRPALAVSAPPRLMLLGRDPALLEHAGGTVTLTGRHAEILLALVRHPGVSAAALAAEIYGDEAAEQTLRAEIVRLRRWLSKPAFGLELLSRPYRLSGPLRVDAIEALQALGRGAHRLALAAYEGAVLPASNAPVAERLRDEVDSTLREAMLQSAAPDALFEYAQNWADGDDEVWQTLLQVLPPLSPKRARVVARLARRR